MNQGIAQKEDNKCGLQRSPVRLRKDQRTETTEARGEKAPSTDCEVRIVPFPLPAHLLSLVCTDAG